VPKGNRKRDESVVKAGRGQTEGELQQVGMKVEERTQDDLGKDAVSVV
jgi:ribosomal protein L13E